MSQENDGKESVIPLTQATYVTFSEFCCTHCQDNKWEVILMYYPDKTTRLVFQCVHPECYKVRQKELGLEEDDQIIWAEFDITGQGFDKDVDDLVFNNNEEREFN